MTIETAAPSGSSRSRPPASPPPALVPAGLHRPGGGVPVPAHRGDDRVRVQRHPGSTNFTWQGSTLRWYRELFAIPELSEAIKNSLVVAAVATVIATALGTLMGLALTRYQLGGGGHQPVRLPPPGHAGGGPGGAGAVAVRDARDAAGLSTMVLSHVMFCTPSSS